MQTIEKPTCRKCKKNTKMFARFCGMGSQQQNRSKTYWACANPDCEKLIWGIIHNQKSKFNREFKGSQICPTCSGEAERRYSNNRKRPYLACNAGCDCFISWLDDVDQPYYCMAPEQIKELVEAAEITQKSLNEMGIEMSKDIKEPSKRKKDEDDFEREEIEEEEIIDMTGEGETTTTRRKVKRNNTKK